MAPPSALVALFGPLAPVLFTTETAETTAATDPIAKDSSFLDRYLEAAKSKLLIDQALGTPGNTFSLTIKKYKNDGFAYDQEAATFYVNEAQHAAMQEDFKLARRYLRKAESHNSGLIDKMVLGGLMKDSVIMGGLFENKQKELVAGWINTAKQNIQTLEREYCKDLIDEGRSHFQSGDYAKARSVYTESIEHDSRNLETRKLRIEANQKLLAADEDDQTAKLELEQDMAMVQALEFDTAAASIDKIGKDLAKFHDADLKTKQEMISGLEAMAQQYSMLGTVQFDNKSDTKFVRKKLSDLSAKTYRILEDFSQADKDPAINGLAKTYRGRRYLAKGKIDKALKVFKEHRSDNMAAAGFTDEAAYTAHLDKAASDVEELFKAGKAEEAQKLIETLPNAVFATHGIIKQIETDKLRRLNVYALEAWRSFIIEGEAVEFDQAKGWVASFVMFGETLAGSETIDDRLAKRWGLEKDLHSAVTKKIADGECNTVKEALLDIKANGPEKFHARSKELLDNEFQHSNDASFVLPHIIGYASALNYDETAPSILGNVRPSQYLMDEAARINDQFMVPNTPGAIYAMIQASNTDESTKDAAGDAIEKLDDAKGFSDSLVAFWHSESLTSLALDIVTFKAAARVGANVFLNTEKALRAGGYSARATMYLSEGAGLVAENTILTPGMLVKAGAFTDTRRVYSPSHMAKEYGANLVMLFCTKGLASRGAAMLPRVARAAGWVVEGTTELSRFGKLFTWAGGHAIGFRGMLASSVANHYLGLRQMASDNFGGVIAAEMYNYVKFAAAQRAIGSKGSKIEHQVASRKASLESQMAVEKLGYKVVEYTPQGEAVFNDATAQKLYHQFAYNLIQKPGFSPDKMAKLALEATKSGNYAKFNKYCQRYGLRAKVNESAPDKPVESLEQPTFHEQLTAKDEAARPLPLPEATRQFLEAVKDNQNITVLDIAADGKVTYKTRSYLLPDVYTDTVSTYLPGIGEAQGYAPGSLPAGARVVMPEKSTNPQLPPQVLRQARPTETKNKAPEGTIVMDKPGNVTNEGTVVMDKPGNVTNKGTVIIDTPGKAALEAAGATRVEKGPNTTQHVDISRETTQLHHARYRLALLEIENSSVEHAPYFLRKALQDLGLMAAQSTLPGSTKAPITMNLVRAMKGGTEYVVGVNIGLPKNNRGAKAEILSTLKKHNINYDAESGTIEVPLTVREVGTSGPIKITIPFEFGTDHYSQPAAPLSPVVAAALGYKLAWNNSRYWTDTNPALVRIPILDGQNISVFQFKPDSIEMRGPFKSLSDNVRSQVTNQEAQTRTVNMVQALQAVHESLPAGDGRRPVILRTVAELNRYLSDSGSSGVSLSYLWSRISYGMRKGMTFNPHFQGLAALKQSIRTGTEQSAKGQELRYQNAPEDAKKAVGQ